MKQLRLWVSFGFVALIISFSNSLQAHEIRPAIATMTINEDRSFTIKMETNVEALIAEIGAEHDDTDDAPTAVLYNQLRGLSSDELKDRFSKTASNWMANPSLSFEGKPAGLTLDKVEIPPVGDVDLARESSLFLSGTFPEAVDSFQWHYDKTYGASVLRIERPGQEVEAQFFAAGAKSEPFKIGVAEPRSWIEKAWDYGVIGFTHILPKGMDHILFVLGLFLLNTNWRPLLVQVTAFTIAHSVTLALGLYGVVNISPSIVEPLIALSIVYVAVENIFTQKLHVWRPIIVFVFGLLHGLGFAGILTEIGLPPSDFILGLIAFNVGVEFGQLAVIALAFLVVGWFVNKPWYRSRVVIPASLAIAAMGAFWFVERTFL